VKNLPLDVAMAETLLPPGARTVEASQLPPNARRLLAHDHDMTPTMEREHRSELRIRLLQADKNGDRYRRRVVLMTAAGKPVLQGQIDIRLDLLTPSARADVLAGRKPLGAVLRDEKIPHRSHPASFFTMESTPELEEVLHYKAPATLSGRLNQLLSPQGEILALVVEILPPTDTVMPS
jgi:chorismate-pyruvate lyase